jgi:hypothetical protein
MGFAAVHEPFSDDDKNAFIACMSCLEKYGGKDLRWMMPSPESLDGCHLSFYFGNRLYLINVRTPCEFQ